VAEGAAARRSVRDPNALHTMMVEQVCRRAEDFDLLHFHLDYFPCSVMSRQAVPFVTTLHGRLDLPEHKSAFSTFSSTPLVSISNAQRRPVPNAKWVGTVYHGLPGEPAQAGADNTLLPCVSMPHIT
jgi:hypothetical protein